MPTHTIAIVAYDGNAFNSGALELAHNQALTWAIDNDYYLFDQYPIEVKVNPTQGWAEYSYRLTPNKEEADSGVMYVSRELDDG